MRKIILLFLVIVGLPTVICSQTFHRSMKNSGSVLISGEYFINTDPGIGLGTTISVGNDGKINISSISLNRNDKLYLRVQDSFGRWSSAKGIKYRYKKLVAAAYAIKYSNGTFSETQLMSISNQPINTSFFVATSNELALLTSDDTVYVSFYSEDGFWNQWVKKSADIVEVEDDSYPIPTKYNLSQNYPNPFNPTTIIKYSIPQNTLVNIIVYDILGRLVTTLVNEEKQQGFYEVRFNAINLSSGVYFYRLQTGEYTACKKFILLK